MAAFAVGARGADRCGAPAGAGSRGDNSRADAAVARRAQVRLAAPRRETFPGRPAQ
jgi:hypothetical protein